MYKVLLGLAVLLVFSGCATRESEVARQDVEPSPAVMAPGQGVERQTAGIAEQQVQTRETNEFMGQAPKIEDIPETIVLEAKNGNVTLNHQEHAKMMDCATCHEGTPGKIPDFGKDKGHALCMGCHKEKKAGPTKCGECHKKA
ncbi:MAG: cytochrome c3 family protein [Desulfuromonadales bacterium]